MALLDVRDRGLNQAARVLRLMVIGLIAVVAVMVGVWLANLYVTEWRALLQAPSATDFYKFYLSGERLQQGLSMYWEPLPRLSLGDACFVDAQGHANDTVAFTDACLHPNLNPPFFAVLVWPLAQLEYAAAWAVWCMVSLCCALLSMGLFVCAYVPQGENRWKWVALASVALLAYFPTYASFAYGQTTFFILLLLVAGWDALRNGRDCSAGVWLGLAASLKPFVALFFLALLFARHVRATAFFGVTCAVAGAVGLMMAGWGAHLDYWRIAGDVTWLAASWNASFAGYFSRIFGGGENIPWADAPSLARFLSAVCSVATLLVVSCLLRRVRNWERELQADVVFALVTPAMLLLSPLGWLYYFPLLFIALTVIWRLSFGLAGARYIRGGLLVIVMVTAIPRALEPARAMNDALSWFWSGAIYNYALISFFVFVALAVRQRSMVSPKGVSVD